MVTIVHIHGFMDIYVFAALNVLVKFMYRVIACN